MFYGQSVKIKNKVEDYWLHASEEKYPLHHLDGKVSSQGPQVSGRKDDFDDALNTWIFLPHNQTMVKPTAPIPIRHGDVVVLFHPATKRFLLTHDVASSLTMTNQEVTTHDWTDVKRRSDMLWTVQITSNTAGANDLVKSMSTQFKLVHVPTKVHLNNHQMSLPSWGHEYREINGCKRGHKESSKWAVSTILDAPSTRPYLGN